MENVTVDISKVTVRQITKAVARRFVVDNHYSHRFSSCRYALGVFYRSEEHEFFAGTHEKLIGCAVFGHPVGNKAIESLTTDNSLPLDAVLELTRLVIYDGYGKNIESYAISQAFHWLKGHDTTVKVLLSYADPEYGHAGTIYQATNWYYQGMGASKLMPDYMIKVHPNGEWIPSRTVTERFGPKNPQKLAETIGHVFWRKEEPSKHRYIYFLCSRKEKKALMKKLKLPVVSYPDSKAEWEPRIERVELVNGKAVVTLESGKPRKEGQSVWQATH